MDDNDFKAELKVVEGEEKTNWGCVIMFVGALAAMVLMCWIMRR